MIESKVSELEELYSEYNIIDEENVETFVFGILLVLPNLSKFRAGMKRSDIPSFKGLPTGSEWNFRTNEFRADSVDWDYTREDDFTIGLFEIGLTFQPSCRVYFTTVAILFDSNTEE